MTKEKLKQAIYFPREMLAEIQAEAARLDRSLSWVLQRAWKTAVKKVRTIPAPPKAVIGSTHRWKSIAERDE